MINLVSEEFRIVKKHYLTKLKVVKKRLGLRGTMTIKIGGNEESQELNKAFRNKDYPTDVLSFPVNEKLPEGYYIGDIFISMPVAEKQAVENGIEIYQELLTLMIHGILHLAGYDHENDEGEMLELQDEIMAELQTS